MSLPEAGVGSLRVLVLAPVGRDAALCCSVLAAHGIEAMSVPNVEALLGELARGAGAIIIVEEALSAAALTRLEAAIAEQEPWSDLPILVFGAESLARRRPLDFFRPLGNVSLLGRPIDPKIMVSAVVAALRGRERQYQALAARRHDEEELRRAEEFQQRLIGIASHDLRNPLSAIAMGASLLRTRELDERNTKIAERILSSAQRMNRIISDLADYSRARVGRGMSLNVRRADFHSVCDTVLDEIRTTNPGRHIAYEPEGDPTGHWDPERLAQMLENLLTNAIKYGDAARPVTLSWRRTGREEHGEELIVRVHNYGQPIAPEFISDVFEPFRLGERVQSVSARSLGLGLFIVREIVRAHGGAVSVSSTIADGTSFAVELPRCSRGTSPDDE